MMEGSLVRRLRAAEAASRAVASVAPLPLVPLWLEAVRALQRGDGTPTPQSAAAYATVTAAMHAIKGNPHRLTESEAELVDACVRVLRTLPLAELRALAGSRFRAAVKRHDRGIVSL